MTKRLAIHAAGILALGGLLVACSHDDGNVGPAGVIYEGDATDEAIVPLLAAKVTASASVKFVAPMGGEDLPNAQAMTFSWSSGLASRTPSSEPSPAGKKLLDEILELVTVRKAHAHPKPLNGQGYYLRVESGGQDIVKVFTSLRSYTPADEIWRRMGQAGGEMKATLVTAFFEKNRITPDGGPFEAPAVTFRIMP